VEKGLPEVITFLLEQNLAGETPLFRAVSNRDEGIIRLLLKYSPDVDMKTEVGETPLFTAVGNRDEGIVRLLLEHGLDVNTNIIAEEAALYCTASNRHDTLSNLILNKRVIYTL
jgi:hypothetical protein